MYHCYYHSPYEPTKTILLQLLLLLVCKKDIKKFLDIIITIINIIYEDSSISSVRILLMICILLLLWQKIKWKKDCFRIFWEHRVTSNIKNHFFICIPFIFYCWYRSSVFFCQVNERKKQVCSWVTFLFTLWHCHSNYLSTYKTDASSTGPLISHTFL